MEHRVTLLACALALSGCFLDRAPIEPTGPQPDSGPRTDGGELDGMIIRLDAGSDGGVRDGGGIDAGIDAGPFDSGIDAGPFDGGVDAGPLDGGIDAGIDAGTDAGPIDSGCSPVGSVCAAGEEVRCAADGTITRLSCALGCASSGDRCARAVPSNVAASFVSASAAPFTFSGATYDASACPGGTIVPQASGPSLCVVSASTVSVPASADVRVIGGLPLVLVASGAVTIDARIDLSARGTTAGPGGNTGGVRSAPDGTGLRPGLRAASSTTYADGGGGGGGLCGAGGNGGTGGGIIGGAGGMAMTSWELSPLQGGSGGAWGRGASGSPDTSANGGAGGGAIQIFSSVSITLNGTIWVGGGGGRPGLNHPDGANYGAGAGGGSGGAVLLEAPTVSFGASARIVATGGGGGGSASGSDGGPGEDGVDATGRARGGTRGGTSYGALGGASGADTTPDGLNGGNNTNAFANGGGGGGGTGCILLRTAGGTLPAGTGSFSPRVPTALSARTLRVD